MRRLVLICTAVALAAGSPAQAAVPAVGEFSGSVEIGGGRSLHLECAGSGTPTVLFESGLRSRGDVWRATREAGATSVFAGVSAFTRACAYDRPGTAGGAANPSRSDPVPMPRSALQANADLERLLAAAAIPGPYVLAGHSTGGLFMRRFAATHPAQTAGLVLVDALAEGVRSGLGPRYYRAYRRLYLDAAAPELGGYEDLEYIAFDASFRQVRRAGPLPRVPLAVLSKGKRFGVPAQAPDGFGPALERAWRTAQRELAGLLPKASWTVVRRAGHNLHVDRPETVIRAVRRVVNVAAQRKRAQGPVSSGR